MKAIVVLEERFVRDPAGTIWSVSGFGDGFWERYLAVFDTVAVLARIASGITPPAGAFRVSDPRVTFVELPGFTGPAGLARVLPRVLLAAARCAAMEGAFILRAPGFHSVLMGRLLTLARRPFAVEAVGFATDSYVPGTFPAWFGPALRASADRGMARLCRRAAAVAYVTERELQRRYPSAPGAFETAYSSIELPASLLVTEPAPVRDGPPYELISVGSMEQMYKGFDILLQAVAAVRAAGTPCRLTLVGNGRCRPELEELAGRLGLADTVRFAGHVPRAEVLELVDRSDLFVLASRHEGLPRALIEAMARAKPCIGTATGGIPELLEVDDMVPVEDSQALAGLVLAVLQDPSRRERMIRRNLRKAQAYTSTTLERRRSEFYRQAAARCLPRPGMQRCVSST